MANTDGLKPGPRDHLITRALARLVSQLDPSFRLEVELDPVEAPERRAELATADSVDLICAFVIWTGVRHLRSPLEAVVRRGGRVRVITTTYMGATEKRAVDGLFSLGASVRVALDARTTKLHAKAWLLERESGLTTMRQIVPHHRTD